MPTRTETMAPAPMDRAPRRGRGRWPAACMSPGTRRTTTSARSSTARIYRSGQMPASSLARTVRDHRIKTVLNLRGSNKDAWYAPSARPPLDAGATQVDIAMSSCIWMSRAQLRTVIETLDSAEYPMLIHCQWGAERTGPGLGVRRAAPPGEHARRCPRPVLDPLPVRPRQRRQDHGRAPRPVRALARRAGMDA